MLSDSVNKQQFLIPAKTLDTITDKFYEIDTVTDFVNNFESDYEIPEIASNIELIKDSLKFTIEPKEEHEEYLEKFDDIETYLKSGQITKEN